MKSMGMFHGAVGNCDFGSMQGCPPPAHLVEKRAELVPGMTNVWYEYLPESYDPAKTYPLIVQLHGGGMDGRRWTNMTTWHMLAEEYGLIVIYPNSPDYQTWRLGSRDVEFLYDLIQLVCKEYSVDRSRIYMQGMSNGDQMTLAFSMKHPEVLAAAGFATGPTADYLFEEGEAPAGALPVIQMRGEKDVLGGSGAEGENFDIYELRYSMNDLNREIWVGPNGLDSLPALTVRGKDNFLAYRGSKADLIHWEVRDMGHREPPCEAQTFWDCLYSGARRGENGPEQSPARRTLAGDEDSFVLSLGSRSLYRKDQVQLMSDNHNAIVRLLKPNAVGGFGSFGLEEMLETEAMYAPVEFFRTAFGADLSFAPDGSRVAVRFPDGKEAVFYGSSSLVRYEDAYQSMKKPCVQLCGVFYVPVGEFCEDMMNLCVSVADDCMLISGHQAQLGRYTARVLRAILGGERRPPEAK